MKYFRASEFDDVTKMSPRLLCALDDWRYLLQMPIYLSPTKGAQWRNDNTNSQHNINGAGQSRAIDVFPATDMWNALICALRTPYIKGIGLYPHWNYKTFTYGMHIDVRPTPNPVIWWCDKDSIYHTIHNMKMLEVMLHELNTIN